MAAVRPCAGAGVAIIGAGLLVIGPVPSAAMPPPDVRAEVQLAGVLGDLTTPYLAFVQHTAGSLKAMADDWLADPLPFLRQIIDNQIGYLHDIFAALQTGGLGAAGEAVLDAVRGMTQNFANVFRTLIDTSVDFDTSDLLAHVEEPSTGDIISAVLSGNFHNLLQNIIDELGTADLQLGLPVSLLLDAIGSVYQGWHALVDTVDAVTDAVRADDWSSAFVALFTAPAVIADAYLNGSGAPLDTLPALEKLLDGLDGTQFDLGTEPVDIPVLGTGTAHLGDITVSGLDGNLQLGGLLAPPAHPDLEVALTYSGGQVVFDERCFPIIGCSTTPPINISSDPDTFTVSRELTGTPIGGIVPGLVNGLPQRLAEAIAPSAAEPDSGAADATTIGSDLDHLLTWLA